MRIPHSSALHRDLGVSMTPMIDVVFLLLIFFVCTASFQLPESMLRSPLSLPGSVAEFPPEPWEPDLEQVLIAVGQRDGKPTLTINGQSIETATRLSELLTGLVQVDATLPVILDIASEVPLGTAIDVYDRCLLAGFRRIAFVAEAQP